VRASPATQPGPRLVRLYTSAGPAPWRFFLVSTNREIALTNAAEPLTLRAEADLPLVLDALLRRPEEIREVRIESAEPADLQAAVIAQGLDSPLAARIELIDAQGNRIDAIEAERGRDPLLTAEGLAPGAYLLRVGCAPAQAALWPGRPATNAPCVLRLALRAAPASPPPPLPEAPLATNILHPMLTANRFDLPGEVQGSINPPGDHDEYAVHIGEQESALIRVEAASIGSELNPLVEILDETGAALLETNAPDVEVEWTAPLSGDYTVRIRDRFYQGGPGFRYRLFLGAPEPQILARTESDALRLRPGGAANLPIRITRPPSAEEALSAAVAGLPPGASADPILIGPAQESATLVLRAAKDAAPGNYTFRVWLMATEEFPPKLIPVLAPIRADHAPEEALLIRETPQLWLTVPAPEAAP